MNITLKVEVDQSVADLKRYEDLPQLLDPPMRKWVDDTNRGYLAGRGQYPAERPGQRYVRTGELGAGFRYEALGSSHYRFVNEVPHVVWVVGDGDGRGQAWMHRGRWFVARERVDGQTPELVQRLEKTLTDAV